MSRPMKDSGIEWIGEIPQNWSRQKIKYATTVSSGEFISKEEYEDDGQYPIIGANGEIGRTKQNVKIREFSIITGHAENFHEQILRNISFPKNCMVMCFYQMLEMDFNIKLKIRHMKYIFFRYSIINILIQINN